MAGGDDKPRRVDVGFAGGQVLSLRMAREHWDGLCTALQDEGGARWRDVKTEDSDVMLDLRQVVYVRLDTEQHRVGF